MADSINNFFMETVEEAVQPLLAKTPGRGGVGDAKINQKAQKKEAVGAPSESTGWKEDTRRKSGASQSLCA